MRFQSTIFLVWTLISFSGTSAFCQSQNLVSIGTAPNGDLYVFGTSFGQLTFPDQTSLGDPYSSQINFFLARFDSNGTTKWVRHITTSEYDYWYCCNPVTCTVDNLGNVYVAGNLTSDSIKFDSINVGSAHADRTAFIAKYDSSGGFIWSTLSRNAQTTIRDITLDEHNNVYAIGDFNSGGLSFGQLDSVSNQGYTQYTFILKLDSSGSGLWLKAMNSTGPINDMQQIGTSISTDSLGHSYITGTFHSSQGSSDSLQLDSFLVPSPSQHIEIFLAQLKPDGSAVWLNKIRTSKGNDFPVTISVDRLSNLFLGGVFEGTSWFSPSSSLSAKGRDGFIARYNSYGSVLWVKQFCPTSYYQWGQSYGVAHNSQGEVFMIGTADSLELHPLPLQRKIWNFIAKLNYSGDAECIEEGNYYPDFNDISVDNFGNVYTSAGEFSQFGDPVVYLSKWNTHCSRLWHLEISRLTYVGLDNHPQSYYLQVYPNPTSGILNIKLPDQLIGLKTITLYNASGRIIMQNIVDLHEGNVQLDLTGQNNGIYFIQVIAENDVRTVKFIKF